MDAPEFFEGKRPLNNTVFVLHKGKATLTCKPWDEWQLVAPTPFTVRCGNSRTEVMRFRYGIQQTERSSFESTLGSSLGVKGVSSVESSLKQTIGQEFTFQVGGEREQGFTFDSPDCGHKHVRLYQLTRCVYLAYEDKRFWHKDAWEHTVVQWLHPIYDATRVEQDDPNCNCKRTDAEQGRDGVPVRIVFDKLSKLAVQWLDNHQLEFADNPVSLNESFVWGDQVAGEISSDLLPDYLRFLTGIEAGIPVQAFAVQESLSYVCAPNLSFTTTETVHLDDNFDRITVAIPSLAQESLPAVTA